MARRHAGIDWQIPETYDGRIQSWDLVPIAVLMDIRDEMKRLNALLGCSNFTRLPGVLRTISRNTAGLRKPRTRERRRKAPIGSRPAA